MQLLHRLFKGLPPKEGGHLGGLCKHCRQSDLADLAGRQLSFLALATVEGGAEAPVEGRPLQPRGGEVHGAPEYGEIHGVLVFLNGALG